MRFGRFVSRAATAVIGFKAPAVARAASSDTSWTIDFTKAAAADDWSAVDDRIMGGSSMSKLVYSDGSTSFQGELIVEGGGFASVRYGKELVLANNVEAFVLKAKSDGRLGYKLTVQTSAMPGGVSYQCLLPHMGSEEFAAVRLPLSTFKPSLRGRPVPDAPPLRAADIRTIGLMLSRYEVGGGGAKASIQPGGFRLQIQNIAAV